MAGVVTQLYVQILNAKKLAGESYFITYWNIFFNLQMLDIPGGLRLVHILVEIHAEPEYAFAQKQTKFNWNKYLILSA